MTRRLEFYTKPSRFNPTLTFEQYKFLLARKEQARKDRKRIKYKDLVQEWGIKQHYMANAIFRGIKLYDYRIWKEKQNGSKPRVANKCWSDLRPTS